MNLQARNAAIGWHNQAAAVVEVDKQTAYRLLCSAVTVDPTFAQGWWMLGNATADLQMYAASVAAFQRVLALPDGDQPGDMTPDLRAKCLTQLSHRLLNDGQIEAAYEASEDALGFLTENPELDPEGRAFAWTNHSLILSIMGDTAASLGNAQLAYEMDPVRADIETGLGFAYLFAGNYADGLKHFDARIPYKLPHYLRFPYQRWDGQNTGTLFIAADQGIGDTISFTRFIPSVSERCERVLFQVQPELLRMMSISLRHWSKVQVIPQEAQFPVADAWCPVFGLPTALGLTTEQIATQPQVWRVPRDAETVLPSDWKVAGRALHVGIAWAGSPLNEIDRWRSVPFPLFLQLAAIPGVQLYSLQVGERVADLHAAGAAGLVRDMSPWIRDALDTAMIMRQLDLIITIDSFIGHLAGALDLPTWVVASRRGGDWRCGRSGDRPLWYRNTALIRQGDGDCWPWVMEDVAKRLFEVATDKAA